MKISEIEVGDNMFWVVIWGFVAAIIMTIILSVSNYNNNKDEMIAGLIRDGYNPISINCALEDNYGKYPTCIILSVLEQDNAILKK